LCSEPEAEREHVQAELSLALEQANLQLGCLALARSMTVIAHPERAAISVTLGSDPPSLAPEQESVMPDEDTGESFD
jgi:hypothetical protein